MRIAKIIVFSVLYIVNCWANASEGVANFEATWVGIEVMGVDKTTADKIRSLIPITKGSPFIFSDKKKYKAYCNIIKEKMGIKEVDCSFGVFDEGVYFDVEVTPADSPPNFRKIPIKKGRVAVLPKKLEVLYRQWEDRMIHLASNRQPIIESYGKGFWDFADPILHETSLKLSKYAYKSNRKILDIIKYSPDENERSKAATLLAWARNHEKNLSFILKWDLLNDPDQGVRNFVARSFSSLMSQVKNKALLKNLLPVYCKMATLPTHTDRNKALYSIKGILEQDPTLRATLNQECIHTITYISEHSILDNVGGVAKEILSYTGEAQHG